MARTKSDIKIYQRLLTYVKPYWKIFALSVFGMIVLALSQPAIAALMQPLMDGAFIEKDPETTRWVPILIILLFLVRGIASYISTVALNWVANKVVMDLRSEMFAKVLNLPQTWFDSSSSGSLVSRFTFDVTQVKEACTSALPTLVRDSFTVIGLLAWMFYVNWLLATVSIVSAPFIAGVMMIIKNRIRKMSRKVQESMGNILEVTSESLDGMREIKLYGAEAKEQQRFDDTANAHRKFSMKQIMAAAAAAPSIQLITAFVLAAIIVVAIKQAEADKLAVGEFVSFFMAVALIPGPLKRLASVNEYIQKGLAGCESVFSIFDTPEQRDEGTMVLDNAKGELVFNNVSYHYEGASDLALKNINLSIKAGETLAIVGESGSGKTTLVNLIARFYETQEGTITLDGNRLQDIRLESLRQQIGFVSQHVMLFNDSVRNNIAYGMEQVDESRLEWAIDAACAREFVDQLADADTTIIGEDGTKLSGGQRQRIAIARALIKDAPILILDEATSALDTKSERHIQEALENLKQGRTCIIIAHRLSTVENADRIVVMHKGEIVEIGRHEDLIKQNGAYSRLHQMQFVDG